MDITTIVGLIFGFTLVVMGILNGGALSDFIDVPSFLMTGGGTIAAYLVASPLHEVISLVSCVGHAFYFPRKYYAKVHPEMFEKLKMRKPEPATDEEVEQLRYKLAMGAENLRRMRAYPIGIGVVGSLTGVTNMLYHLDDSSQIGPGLATALLTVFYGVFMTYCIILPLSQKLEARLKSIDEKFWKMYH